MIENLKRDTYERKQLIRLLNVTSTVNRKQIFES
jgi:hypothetical protein